MVLRTTTKTKHMPIRMCIICKQRLAKKELQRYTCPTHEELKLTMDDTGKNPGRGFYLCYTAACQKKLERFKGWQKKCKGVGHVH